MTRAPTLPKAIFFDLDDTLIFAHAKPKEAWEKAFASEAHRIPGDLRQDLLDGVVESAKWFWSDPERHRQGRLNLGQARQAIVGRAFEQVGLIDEQLCRDLGETFERLRWQDMHLLPGSHETLDALRQSGLGLALVTNGASMPQRAKVERFDLTHRFDHIQIEGEFGIGKPEPEVYHHLLERFSLKPEEAWMVGDNLEWEVAAPQRLGIRAIWRDSLGQGLPAGGGFSPDHVIHSVAEVMELLGIAVPNS